MRERTGRATITFPKSILTRIDEMASHRHRSRSSVVVEACRVFIEAEEIDKCNHCGYINSLDARFCGNCGRPLDIKTAGELFEAMETAKQCPEYQHLLRMLKKDLEIE